MREFCVLVCARCVPVLKGEEVVCVCVRCVPVLKDEEVVCARSVPVLKDEEVVFLCQVEQACGELGGKVIHDVHMRLHHSHQGPNPVHQLQEVKDSQDTRYKKLYLKLVLYIK